MLEKTPVLRTVQPGYRVFAHHGESGHHGGAGQFVGVVEDVIEHQGHRYLHVRGGLEQANELFLPIGTIRAVGGKQVHLNLSLEGLLGRTWHALPTAPLPVG